jgi:hypothetical protein
MAVVLICTVAETFCDPGTSVDEYGTLIRELTLAPPKNALVASNVTFWAAPSLEPTESWAFVPSGHVETTAAWATAGTTRVPANARAAILRLRTTTPPLD